MSGPSTDRLSRLRRALAPLVLVACAFAPPAALVPPVAAGAAGTGDDAVVHPLVLLAADDARLAFSALGRDWEIALEPRELLSPAARAELADTDLPRLYGGHVIGDGSSWVRVSRDADRLSGHLFTDGELYRIEPPPDGSPDPSFDATGESANPGSEGGGYRLLRVGTGAGAALLPRAANAPGVSRAMRVGIVVDSRYDEHHDGRGLARALGVMNGVDGLYREQLGLAVVVERVRVHDDPASDPVRTRGGTIEEVLTAFRGIRLGDPGLPADLALVHLFSGHETSDDVIGLGWIDTVCRVDGYDVSMSTPFAFDTLLSAHEIAHNLGALHDEDPLCAASDDGTPSGGLMEERLSKATVTEFSACSLERLRRALGADCLLDSLDLALDVLVSPADAPGGVPEEWRLAVGVTNEDPFRTASAVRTRTRLPAGGRVVEASAGCSASDELLVCEHGDIAPEADTTIAVRVTLPDGGARDVVVAIDPGTFVDSDPANDRVTLALGAPTAMPAVRRPADDGDGAPLADAGAMPGAGGGAGDGTEGEGGIGRAGAPLLAMLATLARGRRRRRGAP